MVHVVLRDAVAVANLVRPPPLVVVAQLEIESKVEAKLKPNYHILVSSAEIQAISTWVS
jgi:hypothetical protein